MLHLCRRTHATSIRLCFCSFFLSVLVQFVFSWTRSGINERRTSLWRVVVPACFLAGAACETAAGGGAAAAAASRATTVAAACVIADGAAGAGGQANTGSAPLYLPLRNETVRRDVIVEVPEIHVVEKLVPKIHVQDVIRQVPKVDVQWIDKVVEIPQIQVVDKVVEVPEVHEVRREVPRVEVKQVVRHVPRYQLQLIEKYVEVPQVQYVEKYVEVPEVHQIIHFKDRVQIVDVPIENIRAVPKVELKLLERDRRVPGPVEVIGVPAQPAPVIVEGTAAAIPVFPVQQTPIPLDIPLLYQALPAAAAQEGLGCPCVPPCAAAPAPPSSSSITCFSPEASPRFSSCSSPLYTSRAPLSTPDSAAPRTHAPLVQPIVHNQIINEEPIYEQTPPRYVYGGSVWAPAVYDTSSRPIDASAPSLSPPWPVRDVFF